MTATIILAAIAFASTVITVAVPVWRGRRKGPDSTAVILTASATYFNSLHESRRSDSSKPEDPELQTVHRQLGWGFTMLLGRHG
jgi:hypothetical protein